MILKFLFSVFSKTGTPITTITSDTKCGLWNSFTNEHWRSIAYAEPWQPAGKNLKKGQDL